MTKYICFLESGRDFIINADDDMDAAYTAQDYAACMYDDYLTDLDPIYLGCLLGCLHKKYD